MEVAEFTEGSIMNATMEAMNKEGCPFKGVLYIGLMLTPDGPKVLEYNARFGDPETQVVLPLLDGDLFEIVDAIIDERLSEVEFTFKDLAGCVVVMASGGYPVKYDKGYAISGINDAEKLDTTVFHAGTAIKDSQIVTNGGRVLGVTALAETMDEAITKAYKGVEAIKFDKAHYRSDIG